MRRALVLAFGLAALCAALVPASAGAAAGELDPTFGAGGSRTLNFGGSAEFSGIATQPDNKILISGGDEGGTLDVVRFLENGELDPSFGSKSFASVGIAKSFAFGVALAVQPDGRIVAAGEIADAKFEEQEFFVARFLPNGAPDTSFGGGDGYEAIPFGEGKDEVRDVALGAGGRILLTGTEYTSALSEHKLIVAALLENGDLDPAFGTGGIRTITTKGSEKDDQGNAIAAGTGGTVLVGDSASCHGFRIIRLLANGENDKSFSGNGVVTTPIPRGSSGCDGSVEDLAQAPDGRIVAAGYGYDEPPAGSPLQQKFAAVRYLADGQLDPGFASGGIFARQVGGIEEAAQSVAIAPDGKVLLSGYDEPVTGKGAFAVLRLDSAGVLDPTFGVGGEVQAPVIGDGGSFGAGNLDAQGRYVTLSEPREAGEGGKRTVLLDRYTADPPPQPAPPLGPPAPIGPPAANPPPHAKLKAIPKTIDSAKLKGFSGSADASAATVQIALELLPAATPKKAAASKAGGKKTCLQLKSPRAKFKTVKAKKGTACPLRWLNVTGTSAWSYKLKKSLPAGHYVVYARALNAAGGTETTFSKAAGDRIAFRVVSR